VVYYDEGRKLVMGNSLTQLFGSIAEGSVLAMGIFGLLGYALGARGAAFRWILLLSAIVGGLEGYWSNPSTTNQTTAVDGNQPGVDPHVVANGQLAAGLPQGVSPTQTFAPPANLATSDVGTLWTESGSGLGSVVTSGEQGNLWEVESPRLPNNMNGMTPTDQEERLWVAPPVVQQQVNRLRFLGSKGNP
jgi:hypothetical protein